MPFQISTSTFGYARARTRAAILLLTERLGGIMKVQDVMINNVRFCNPDMNLAGVAETLWKAGCGTLPVVENGRVIGMITDRDIAIALGTRNVRASEAIVRDVSLPKLFYTTREEDIHIALHTMGAQKVR